MTTLYLDIDGCNIAMPESRKDGYKAELVPLSVDKTMISGRMVMELSGEVWRITYKYGYFEEEMKNQVIAACQKGRRTPIGCTFLPPKSRDYITSRFWVLDFKDPKFYWFKNDRGTRIPLWGDFSLTLREVKPSD